YLCTNHLWRAWGIGDRQKLLTTFAGQAFYWTLTFLAVVIAWVFFRAKTLVGALQMLFCLLGFETAHPAYVPPGIVRVLDLPLLVGEQNLLLIGGSAVALALAFALFLPNVPQLFRYREYRRKPEPATLLNW